MKIAFLDDEPEIYPAQYGGKAITIHNFARQFANNPRVSHVVIMSRSIRSDHDEFELDGIRYKKLADYAIVRDIIDTASSYDVLNVHTCSFTMPLLHGYPCKKVYHLHDVIFATIDAGSHADKALGNIWSSILSPSEFAKTTLANIGWWRNLEEEISVIRRGINTDTFYRVDGKEAIQHVAEKSATLADKIHQSYPIIFFPHRPGANKGEELVEQALEILKQTYPHPLVIMPGEQSSENVQGTGWLPTNELRTYYSLAHMTLVLSKLPESFSQVVIESLTCKTPVIACRSGNLASLIESIPGVYETRPTPQDIARAIDHLAKYDPAEDLQASTHHLKHYDIRKVAEEMLDHYEKIKPNDQMAEPVCRTNTHQLPPRHFLSPFAMLYENAVYLPTSKNIHEYPLTRQEHATLDDLRHAKEDSQISMSHRELETWQERGVVIRI